MINVELKIGSWFGQCNLMVVPLDDSDVIIRNEFLAAAQLAVMPHLEGLLFADANNHSFMKWHTMWLRPPERSLV